MFARSLVALALAAASFAVITPTSPDSATVVKVGENINALWSTDTTGQWTNVQIQLMTGDNQAMVPLLTLATGIDGTKEDSFSYPAPEVEPYSKIYFLQFTLGGDVSTATWTTRFTIAGPNGETTEPTNTTTFDGQTVGWGTGMVINAANATAGGASSNSTSSTSPLSMSASASPSAVASASDSAMQLAAPSSASASASRSISQSASASRAAAASASTTGAAAHLAKVQFSLGAIALGLAGFAWL